MANKGERTREQIVEKAAALFNQHGYHKASIADVMRATGLEKGGIYRHFSSKEELALAAFRFAAEKMRQRFTEALLGKVASRERLRAIVSVYARIPEDPPVPGGCPILNASTEADDSDPELREEARRVMKSLTRALSAILREGRERGELRSDVEIEPAANVFIAGLEGAVMLSKLYGSSLPMRHVTAHLHDFIDSRLANPRRP
jgi:TetR/AcrR family transcriptional repressor of nem operon